MHMTTFGPALPMPVLERYAHEALEEDLGSGDVTTDLLIARGSRARAVIVARSEGVVCGLQLAATTFRTLDSALRIRILEEDGAVAPAGAPLLEVEGSARAILAGERVALNFVGRMSGIASLTRRFVDAVEGTGVRIIDTRKTTPGLRALEKYAVRCGGGHNHRYSLSDGFMLKDNHRASLERAGVSLVDAVRNARERLGHGVAITIEVDTADQVAEALEAGADSILLDNMDPEQLALAVRQIDGGALAEASGGITLASVRAAAESGVDLISVGALTHSAPALDVALDLEWRDGGEG